MMYESALYEVSRSFEMRPAAVVGRRQSADVVRARAALVWVLNEVLEESFAEIARLLGRHRTTVVSSRRKADALLAWENDFVERVVEVRQRLNLVALAVAGEAEIPEGYFRTPGGRIRPESMGVGFEPGEVPRE